ncbi:MAG: hypothetical protein L6R39_004053 [Caloplaca ligustica]|nr:MAG: hypothetical protein L6R39_004053 [Caloplaca ligustica]
MDSTTEPLNSSISSSSHLQERQAISSVSDLSYHVVEAGHKDSPLLILLHGFPEFAYPWRKIMAPLAQAGYYVVAFDQRGYGRTTGWDARPYHEVDLNPFAFTNLVRDVIVLAHRLRYREVECIIGHDFGCVPASLCALIRLDFFKRVVLMGHPFLGTPILPFNSSPEDEAATSKGHPQPDLHEELAKLPHPKKHYRKYYSGPDAAAGMSHPASTLKSFLRGYFHLKSADAYNDPQPIQSLTAKELDKLPPYYIMPLHLGMRDTIAEAMTPEEQSKMKRRCDRWLPDSDLQVYVDEFARTGFQGALNWCRVSSDPGLQRDLDIYAGRKLEVPCLYMVGTKDWLLHQTPNTVDWMREACTQFHGPVMIEGAGHWPQQEQPKKVVDEILEFLKRN